MAGLRGAKPTLLLALGAMAALAAGCGGNDSDEAAAGGLTKVTIIGSGPPGGKLANIVAAQQRGYFRDEGIEVELSLLDDSSAAMKLIGSGKAEIALLNPQDQIIGRSRGVPVVGLGTVCQDSTHGLMAPAGSGITTPKDLEGLTVGLSGLPGNTAHFKEILRRYGADVDTMKLVKVGFDGAEALATGSVQALGDAASWQTTIVYNSIKGKPPGDTSTFTYVPYTKLGVRRYYSLGLATTEPYVQENKDTVRRFMRGWRKGLEWAVAHPEEAARLTHEVYPEVNLETTAGQWNALVATARSPETDRHGLGWVDPKVYRGEAKFLYENGMIEEPVDTDAMFTNY